MAFLCISPARVLDDELTDPEARARVVDDIQGILNNVEFEGSDKLVLCLPGGGIAGEGNGRCPEMAVVGPFIAVLSGSLQNYAYLVRKYCLEDLGLPSTISLEAIRERTPIREAALLCKLYERLGTGLLTKLRGQFSFCLYDSSTLRVLAARDPTGAVPLFRGETVDGYYFVGSGSVRPLGEHEDSVLEAGHFIYGWDSTPKKYANPQDVVERSAAQAVGAAAQALKGISISPKPEPPKPRTGRRSLDVRRNSSEHRSLHRRRSADSKGRGTPDYDVWRRPAGSSGKSFGKKTRRGGRSSTESDGGSRRSMDSETSPHKANRRNNALNEGRRSSAKKTAEKAKGGGRKSRELGGAPTNSIGGNLNTPPPAADLVAGEKDAETNLTVAPVH